MSEGIDSKDGWHLWPIADVLSVEADRLLCGDMGEMYEFLNWMTGDNLFTHQLVRAMDVCRPYLESKVEWLKGCMDGGTDKDECLALLGKLMAEHGEYIEVPRLPEGVWESRNPMVELFEMMNGKENSK